jgi:hypothetical protein
MNAPFEDERTVNARLAATILGAMVADSIEGGSLPPPEVFKWFVEYVTLQFVQQEFEAAHSESPTPHQIAQVEASEAMLKSLMKLLDKTQQYTLLHDLKKVLDVRRLSLPASYSPVL